jgi:hypothetical protein
MSGNRAGDATGPRPTRKGHGQHLFSSEHWPELTSQRGWLISFSLTTALGRAMVSGVAGVAASHIDFLEA